MKVINNTFEIYINGERKCKFNGVNLDSVESTIHALETVSRWIKESKCLTMTEFSKLLDYDDEDNEA